MGINVIFFSKIEIMRRLIYEFSSFFGRWYAACFFFAEQFIPVARNYIIEEIPEEWRPDNINIEKRIRKPEMFSDSKCCCRAGIVFISFNKNQG